ncbi:hypothetical protein [Pseudobacteriovorax antillogorgiicola]|uniref:Uncharacterized protein n=1 Tax=Pseudobacteriovorax antillogorgiicola TaxID=1513793 RepID=A0A1Y6B5X1_9BACT|nr:hypothetical protein [Pseudobacteriovorax antillogorgiicola]TCS58865.1 hypothetical protein EDD56_102380 [Pseudobacteriovorax antillogorgiicola]SME93907.1 hypothetical protein SAMN06296036_10263 [Pseudobacteriovorax antillogorgiicola]
MSQAAHLSDEEFFYSYLPEFLDDQLSPQDRSRFEGIAKQRQWEHMEADYGIAKGQLQLGLQKLFVDEYLNHELHVLVEDDAERANHEAGDIEEYGKVEVWGGVMRGTFIASFVALVVGLGYYFLGPKRKPPFSALDSLVYESVVMIEDPEDRLDFPTSSLEELRDYFSRYPDLGFRVRSIKSPGSEWLLEGGTVIDYEVQKIIAAQFKAQDEHLFIYLFEGEMDDFPSSTPGNYDGLLYRTYTSEYFNILVWSVSDEVVGMVVGARTAEQLAQVAMASIGI